MILDTVSVVFHDSRESIGDRDTPVPQPLGRCPDDRQPGRIARAIGEIQGASAVAGQALVPMVQHGGMSQ
jgi:hypothetical protein